MALTYGPWTFPWYMYLPRLGATGRKVATKYVTKWESSSVTTTDRDMTFGQLRRVGPGCLLTYNVTPASTSSSYTLKAYVDGDLYHSASGMAPTGDNFLIGGFFDDYICGVTNYPTVAPAFFEKGFELWAQRASGLGSSYYVQAVYCLFDLK